MHWTAAHGNRLGVDRIIEKQTQAVNLRGRSMNPPSGLAVPLIPITLPRPVVAGWENIVREIDIEGMAAPASHEVESRILQIMRQRQQANPRAGMQPIRVWALVIPPGGSHIVELAFRRATPLPAAMDSAAELDQAAPPQ